jgi:hypothetical protein
MGMKQRKSLMKWQSLGIIQDLALLKMGSCFWGWKAATQTFGWQAVVIRQRKRKRLRAGGIIGHVTNQGEILGWQAGG